MRYFLVDKVTSLARGARATGIKNVTLTDGTLHDHFPDHPLFPGALVIEALAQLGGFLIEMSDVPPDHRAILVGIDRAKFSLPAQPGDQIELDVTLRSRMDLAAQLDAEARVGGQRAARASLTFMLRHVASARVHEQRRSLYRLWMRDLDTPPELL